MQHLPAIMKALNNEAVKYIVCGGIAGFIQGLERTTDDLDLSVDFDRANIEALIRAMEKLALQPRAPIAPEVLTDPKQVADLIKHKNAIVFTFHDPAEPKRQVDIFLIDALSYQRLEPDSDNVEAFGTTVRVLTRKGLLQLKREINPPRGKDIFDIKQLEKLIEQDHDDQYP